MTRVRTLIQWTDPAGHWHEPGQEEVIDTQVVFDLADLAKSGVVEVLYTTASAAVVDVDQASQASQEGADQ